MVPKVRIGDYIFAEGVDPDNNESLFQVKCITSGNYPYLVRDIASDANNYTIGYYPGCSTSLRWNGQEFVEPRLPKKGRFHCIVTKEKDPELFL